MQKGLPEFPAIMFGEQYPFSDYVEYMECESRYHLFPVQHEIRRRKEDYNRALTKIRRMVEPFISADSNACDGINYWELADNFCWETDFNMSTYTRNFAARIIQRSFRSFKALLVELNNKSTNSDKRVFKVSRRKKLCINKK